MNHTPQQPVYGWDIGGAHVKCAAVQPDGRIAAVTIEPCRLWLGLGELKRVLGSRPLTAPAVHAVTMTGELVDLFDARAEGVAAILAAFDEVVRPAERFVLDRGGRLLHAAPEDALALASANWQAPAALLAARGERGLFVDVGSTTTDLVTVGDGRVTNLADDDFGRLATGELRYFGVIRTPLFHVLPAARLEGREHELVPELFADIGDAMVVAGRLPPDAVTQPGLDGRPRSRAACRRRIARALGDDLADDAPTRFDTVARQAVDALTARLRAAIEQRSAGPRERLIGAGVGRFLVAEAARGDRAYIDFECCVDAAGPAVARTAADAAPAAALALLAYGVAQAAGARGAEYAQCGAGL